MKRSSFIALMCGFALPFFAQQSTSYTGAVINQVKVLETQQSDVVIKTNIPTERTIDGENNGIAEAEIYTMRCGNHKLVLKADGYYTLRKNLTIRPNVPNEFFFRMKKKTSFPRPTQWQQFVMLDYTWGKVRYPDESSTSSLGLRYGWQKVVGWYVAMNVSLQGSHYAMTTTYLGETNRISRNKFSLMGGANFWLGCPLYFYTGRGYGYENVLEVSPDGKYTRPYDYYDNFPNNGVAWECGLQGGYKGVTVRLGYALVGSKSAVFNEVSLGVGYTFDLKK